MHASSRNLVELPCWYSDRCAIDYSPCGRPTPHRRVSSLAQSGSVASDVRRSIDSRLQKKIFVVESGGVAVDVAGAGGQEHRQPLRWARDHATGCLRVKTGRPGQSMSLVGPNARIDVDKCCNQSAGTQVSRSQCSSTREACVPALWLQHLILRSVPRATCFGCSSWPPTLHSPPPTVWQKPRRCLRRSVATRLPAQTPR